MMDHMIIITLIVISTFSIVNGQLHCFVCTNCPNLDYLDAVSQPCDFVSPPDTPPPPTTPSTTTISTTITPPTATPPTATQSPTAEPTEEPTVSVRNNSLVYESLIKAVTSNDSPKLRDGSTDEATDGTQILPQPSYRNSSQLSGIYQCFRITRTVGDTAEVVRGCVIAANSQHQTCVRANLGVAPIACRICQHDGCNGAKRNISTSMVMIFTSIVSTTFLRQFY